MSRGPVKYALDFSVTSDSPSRQPVGQYNTQSCHFAVPSEAKSAQHVELMAEIIRGRGSVTE